MEPQALLTANNHFSLNLTQQQLQTHISEIQATLKEHESLLDRYRDIVHAKPIEQQLLVYLIKMHRAVKKECLLPNHTNKLNDPEFFEMNPQHSDEEKLKVKVDQIVDTIDSFCHSVMDVQKRVRGNQGRIQKVEELCREFVT